MLPLFVSLTVPVAADTLTISSSVSENGLDQTIGNGYTFTPSGGFDFSKQPYSSLASISSLSLTLTVGDGDSAKGNLDYDKLTLTLGGVNTGLVLNGFRDGYTDTLSFSDVPRDASGNPSSTVGNAILSALDSNAGHLAGGIVSTDKPSYNQIGTPTAFNTTLSLTGETKTTNPPHPPTQETWGVTLSSASKSGSAGTTLTYSGTIQNNTGGDIVLDSALVLFSTGGDSSLYTRDYADAFLSTLGIIPTSGYSGPLFTLAWANNATVGMSGTGSFQLTSSSLDPATVSADFGASVSSPAPEPASFALAFAGLFTAACFLGLSSRRPRVLTPATVDKASALSPRF